MAVQVVRKESLEQALCRLAHKARECGVRLKHDRTDGRYYASSVSHPGEWHYVTGYSCDCQGFARHHRCMHYAALLAALGWLPSEDQPEPEPPATMVASRCPDCGGDGFHRAWDSARGGLNDWTPVRCATCDGAGSVERHAA